MDFVLVTGGAGYIGSHTVLELARNGMQPVILDNFCNSSHKTPQHLAALCARDIPLVEADARDEEALERVFSEYPIRAVIHFAGLKAVGDSTHEPLTYYRNNLDSTMALLAAMQRHKVTRMVFSSSATVYQESKKMPLTEDAPLGCANPYGWTKLMCERILTDVCRADNAFSAVLLRYFNPVGADASGRIGEAPAGTPNNLMPYITRVARGELPNLPVFGSDYPTRDGTGVRDYIHVTDLARAHVLALDYAAAHAGAEAINIGRGEGCSVLELVHAFEEATGVSIPLRFEARRAGDIAEYWAATDKARQLLGFSAERGLVEMCRDAWEYEKRRDME